MRGRKPEPLMIPPSDVIEQGGSLTGTRRLGIKFGVLVLFWASPRASGEKTSLFNSNATNPLFGEPVNGIGTWGSTDCLPILIVSPT